MEDVSDKCWYCKAILPHHRRFGPLLRTTMSYEAIKWVFVSGIARRIRGEGFSSKSNTSLLPKKSWRKRNHSFTSETIKCPMCVCSSAKLCVFPDGRTHAHGFFRLPTQRPLKGQWFFFVRLKIAFWIESGERAMRGAGPSEAPSKWYRYIIIS